MITGMHGMFFSPEADALRAFLRDGLGLPFRDAGGGWLIFDVPMADVAVHPYGSSKQTLSFFCDDIHKTVDELKAKGTAFSQDVIDEGWGYRATMSLPGGIEADLVQRK